MNESLQLYLYLFQFLVHVLLKRALFILVILVFNKENLLVTQTATTGTNISGPSKNSIQLFGHKCEITECNHILFH